MAKTETPKVSEKVTVRAAFLNSDGSVTYWEDMAVAEQQERREQISKNCESILRQIYAKLEWENDGRTELWKT